MNESESNRHFPNEANLGKPCMFWNSSDMKCMYPKAELEGRETCLGIVDDVCLYVRCGRTAVSLTRAQEIEVKGLFAKGSNLPPGTYI